VDAAVKGETRRTHVPRPRTWATRADEPPTGDYNMTAIIVLLVVVILLMFKPVRMLVGFLFVLGMIGYFSTKDDNKSATAATPDKPAVTAAAPAKEPEKKPPPPVPYAGQEVSEEFFTYIYPETAYVCIQAIKQLVKYNMRAPGLMYGTNDMNSPFFVMKMTRWSKRVANNGSIMLAGDDVEIQNGFGNWVKANYTCTIDPVNKLAKSVTLNHGMLPR
jgi:hypothetical protein